MNNFSNFCKTEFRALLMACLLILTYSSARSQILQSEGLNMPGTYDGFNNPPTNLKFANSSQVAGGLLNINSSLQGQRIWQTIFSAASSGGDIIGGNYDFLFTSGPSSDYYQNKWGGVTSWTLNAPNNVFIGTSQPNNNCTFTNGKYYTVNWLDLGYVDTRACIMETGGNPVNILSSSNATPCASSSTLISFSLSASPSAQEIFYVRWSIDNFVTSSLVAASVAGTSGTASIPAQTGGSVVKYYVFSSTVSSGNIGTDYDLCTIKLNSNGGANFSYTVPNIILTETHVDPTCSSPTTGSIDLSVSGGTPYPPPTQSYSQLFNTLANSGTNIAWTDNSTIANWFSNKTTYNSGTGSVTTGALYSFGAASNSERAIGSVCSGTSGTILYAVKITNTTGQTVTSISVDYNGEQWRNGGNTTIQKLDFAYQVNASNISSGTWVDVNALDFNSPIHTATATALDGNAAANRSALSSTFSVSISPGSTIWLRWSDIDDTGNDHGLGVDDLNVTLSAAGGTSYLYNWSTGATTEDISGLSSGTYTVTVTDFNGCTATSSITLAQAGGINLSQTHTNVSCNGGSDGAIDLTASGGAGSFTYSWSNGATTEDISGLTAGSYTVTVTDIGGCFNSLSVTLSEPTALSLTETHSNVSCHGGSNGSINLTVTGGTAPYTYLWNNGATSEDIMGLSEGSYSVTVTDSHNCISSTTISITQPASISLSETPTDVSCHGANNGSIDLSITGGTPTPPPSYAQNFNTLANAGTNNPWVDNSTIPNWYSSRTSYDAGTGSGTAGALYSFGSAASNDRAIGSLASGGTGTILYAYKYTNTSGETITSITANYTGEEWRCGGNVNAQKLTFAYQVDAANISSGTWNEVVPLDFTSPVNSASAATLDGNAAANRTVLSSTFTVSVPPGSSIWLRWMDINDGGNDHGLAVDDLSFTFVSPGGGYTYNWSNGATTQDVSSLPIGSYNVTVTDANGCSATSPFVSISQPDTLIVSATDVNASCSASSDGAIDLTVTGGVPSYSYNWSNGEITEDIEGLAAGIYPVTVIDANGCTASLTDTVGFDELATTWYLDGDNDGYGDPNITKDTCSQPAGYVGNNGDCNDTSASINPAATEICGNNLDDNCNFQVDEGCATFLTLQLKFFIQGYTDDFSPVMKPVLLNEGIGSDPNEVDTVTIVLHDASSFVAVDTFKGLLHVDGTMDCTFFNASNVGSYYIAILYKNTLETWSAVPVSMNPTDSFDFSTDVTQAYPDPFNSNPQEAFIPGAGVWAIYSGDVDQNGSIDGGDFNAMEPDVVSAAFGYNNSDITGDGPTDGGDYNLLEPNVSLTLFVAHP